MKSDTKVFKLSDIDETHGISIIVSDPSSRKRYFYDSEIIGWYIRPSKGVFLAVHHIYQRWIEPEINEPVIQLFEHFEIPSGQQEGIREMNNLLAEACLQKSSGENPEIIDALQKTINQYVIRCTESIESENEDFTEGNYYLGAFRDDHFTIFSNDFYTGFYNFEADIFKDHFRLIEPRPAHADFIYQEETNPLQEKIDDMTEFILILINEMNAFGMHRIFPKANNRWVNNHLKKFGMENFKLGDKAIVMPGFEHPRKELSVTQHRWELLSQLALDHGIFEEDLIALIEDNANKRAVKE